MSVLYDDQALTYDQRTSLGPHAPERIVEGIAQLAKVARQEGALVEVGVGTGQIGIELARSWKSYFGIDRSMGMLRQFQRRAAEQGLSVSLIHADGQAGWPLREKAFQVVFGSRSLHHLDPDLLLRETQRLMHARGGVLIQGAIRRGEGSMRDALSGEMHKNLEAEGYSGRRRRQWKKKLREAAQSQNIGLEELPEIVAASWMVRATPLQALETWATKRGLDGLEVPDAVKVRVLKKTEEWAIMRFGSLTTEIESREDYELYGFYLPPLK